MLFEYSELDTKPKMAAERKENPIPKSQMRSFGGALCQALRHDEDMAKISNKGFLTIDQLLGFNRLKKFRKFMTVETLTWLASVDSKSRYQIKTEDDVFYIRASQGHTRGNVKSEDLLTPMSVADCKGLTPVHRTNRNAWKMIRFQGANAGKRQHLHCARSADSKTGIRETENSVDIYIDLEGVAAAGFKVWLSFNDIILIEPKKLGGVIPTCFFVSVIDLNTGKVLEIPSAEEAAELARRYARAARDKKLRANLGRLEYQHAQMSKALDADEVPPDLLSKIEALAKQIAAIKLKLSG